MTNIRKPSFARFRKNLAQGAPKRFLSRSDPSKSGLEFSAFGVYGLPRPRRDPRARYRRRRARYVRVED